MPPILTISSLDARRFMRRATGLDVKFLDIAEALNHLGYIQIDPINVCGRMQDLILRNRVHGYCEHGLMEHLHGSENRTAFEHHLPDSCNLAAMPMDAWPHLQRTMEERTHSDSIWSGKLSATEKPLAKYVLDQIAEKGSINSQDIVSARKTKQHAWDSTTLAKSTLQKLFFHGRVMIVKREGNRRYYDLPERVLTTAILNAPTPLPAETLRWLALLKLRQRRLALLKASELRALDGAITEVRISDADTPRLHCMSADVSWIHDAPPPAPEPLLIAPLDPIVYDRRLTDTLWKFDYRWEVYTPPQKRVRGYYALPLLAAEAFVGHVDLKADRALGKLNTVGKKVQRGHSPQSAVRSLADFLGLTPR